MSVRPPEQWWNSFDQTIRKLIDSRTRASNRHIASVLDYAFTIINQQTFGTTTIDKSTALEVYELRIAEVKATIPADRLLEFDVAQGWAPLCNFLGQAEPVSEFPHVNDAKDFWRHFGSGIRA